MEVMYTCRIGHVEELSPRWRWPVVKATVTVLSKLVLRRCEIVHGWRSRWRRVEDLRVIDVSNIVERKKSDAGLTYCRSKAMPDSPCTGASLTISSERAKQCWQNPSEKLRSGVWQQHPRPSRKT